MRIIAGKARNLELNVPDGIGVRPTSGRGRKALLDSLGPLDGAAVLDLFAGSGAFALECASRGAEEVTMVELSAAHIAVIRENCLKVRRTGVESTLEIIQGDVRNVGLYARKAADLIFADPPYAESGALFREVTGNAEFQSAFEGAMLVWEIPDTPGARGEFIDAPPFEDGNLRNLGGVWFFMGTVKKL